MSAGGAFFRKLGVAAALAIPFVAIALAIAEIWLRLTTNLPYLSRTQCFTQSEVEAPGFRPGCRELLRTPGGEVEFHTNEDGYRDRPRAFFRRGAVALLGDSYVEGFWMPEERAFARVLERKLGWDVPLLNLGIRGTGPSQQAIRLYRALELYPIRGVIWVLNPSDPLDEMYFLARNPGFEARADRHPSLRPLWSPSPWYWRFTRLSLLLRDRSYVLLYLTERWLKQSAQTELVSTVAFSEERHCRTVAAVAAELRSRRLPLVFVGSPQGMAGHRRPYLGMKLDDALFDRLLACARKTGAPTLDLRSELDGDPEWYWRYDYHWNDKGVEAATDIVAPALRRAWPAGGK